MKSNSFLLVILFVVCLVIFITSVVYYYSKPSIDYIVPESKCPINQCSTSLLTGKKTCPSIDQSVPLNVGEVCNLQDYCNNTLTPYPLSSDGYTLNDTKCEDSSCSCLTYKICPDYVLSYFVNNDGIFSVEAKLDGKSLSLSDNEYCIVGIQSLSDLGCYISSVSSSNQLSNCLDPNVINICPIGLMTAYTPNNEDINQLTQVFCGPKICDTGIQTFNGNTFNCS